MKTFAINTLGCKVNQYESQQIRELFEQLGLKQVESTDNPDLVVINTCCVTRTASAKSRQCIRKVRKLNPGAVAVACGCLPAVEVGELDNIGKDVLLISHRDNLAALLKGIVNEDAAATNPQSFHHNHDTNIRTKNGRKIKDKNRLGENKGLGALRFFKGQTRAFLKVQDGCDGWCSYCIIPQARPVVWSKPIEAVVEEAQVLVNAGHKEIVLTGIFLGAYGQESVRRQVGQEREDRLAELLDRVAGVEGLARIRLSSLEPADVTERLLDVFCRHRNIMPHLHLSLQSGSDAVLKRMRRQYDSGEFMEVVERIRKRLDRAAITADLMVGFPGETEGDFEATVGLARRAGFAKMHVFRFSARAGTAAVRMQGVVRQEVMKERAGVLHELDKELGRGFREQFIGEQAEILVEGDDGQISGRSERYFMVYAEKSGIKAQKKGLVRVKLTGNREDGVMGQIVA